MIFDFQIFASLAWIYWDPKPYVFVVPYLNHPLTWYGLLFVIGFIAGFFIFLPLLRNKLLTTRAILPRDIESWPKLIEQLQQALTKTGHPLQPILQKLDKQNRQKIIDFKISDHLSEDLKSAILLSLSESLKGAQPTFKRTDLEYLLPKSIYPIKELSFAYTDKLVWFIVIGTVVGARLGHVFFYDWPRYKDHLLDIFKTWEGGLASHGGTLGILIAVYLFQRTVRKNYPEISFLGLCDLLTIPTAFGVTFIRLGNFVNQEILGIPSSLPWAIIFGHPIDGESAVPRHPVQLYEALAYLLTFIILWKVWKAKSNTLPKGFMLGLFFTLVFGSRFFIEFLKVPQGLMIDESFLSTGQYLSIPFILLGLALMFMPRCSKSANCEKLNNLAN
jgi:phosphatidylglycerol---prolipoprotein diacylglyceryl transferase